MVRGQGLPQKARLKKSSEFNRAGEAAHKEVGRFFVVLGSRNLGEEPRLGLAIGKKVGNAVQRNRIKRIVREAFRTERIHLPNRDFIIIGRAGSGDGESHQLWQDIHNLLKRFKS